MTSTVGDVLDALGALAGSALPTFDVIAGQVGTYVSPNQLLLGDVHGTETQLTLGAGNFSESYDITCELHCYAGGVDITGRRTAAIAAWQTLRSAINTDPTLGISDAMHAWISEYTLTAGFDGVDQSNTVTGVSAQCKFTVQVSNVTD